MSPFEPAGDRARWRVLYDIIRVAEVGEVVSYDRMGRALDVDPDAERATIQLAMRRAARELESADKHAVEVVVNEGYRVVEPEGHLDLAQRQQRRAGRALERGQSKVVNVDFNGMDPQLRKAFEVVAGAFAAQIDFNRRLDARQRNLEKAVESVTKSSAAQAERTEEELTELRTRLARLEQRSPDT